MTAAPDQRAAAGDRLRQLKRDRPRSRFLRFSLAAFGALILASFFAGTLGGGELPWSKRWQNIGNFIGEAKPYPLQKGEGWAEVWAWAKELAIDGGRLYHKGAIEAAWITLLLSVAAIVLAAAGAALVTPFAARSLATAEPYAPSGRRPGRARRLLWAGVVAAARGLLIFLRSIPEYIWAFLFVAMLGPHAWPAVLALAIHNMGILGRLGSEVIENADANAPSALRAAGAGRAQIFGFAILPASLARLLVYFFYRWETCVREATILGFLGIASLGFFITEARAKIRYDEMLYFVLAGAAIVLLGDFFSAILRRWVRQAG
ncbi:MAG: ABC transporter permease subunit [Verrucomicrobiales bacterium]